MFCNKSLCCIVHILVTRTTDYQGGNIRGINWVFFTHPNIDANVNPLGNANVYYSKLYQYQYLHGQYTWLVRQDLNNCKKVNWKKKSNKSWHHSITCFLLLNTNFSPVWSYGLTQVKQWVSNFTRGFVLGVYTHLYTDFDGFWIWN